MKLSALAQRGARKDFVDVWALGSRYRPLEGLLACYRQRFSIADIGHLLVALAYFDDAESEPMPEMLLDVSWPEIRATVSRWVKEIALAGERGTSQEGSIDA